MNMMSSVSRILFLLAAAVCLLAGGLSLNSYGQGGTGRTEPKPAAPAKTNTPKSNKPIRRSSNSGRANQSNTSKSEENSARNVEIVYWESIRSSTNPDDFRAYLNKYPSGEFADIARNKINSLEAAERDRVERERKEREREERERAEREREERERNERARLERERVERERAEKELFPLYGVILGKTTEAELMKMGQRSTMINSSTNQPYQYYRIQGSDFWYYNGVSERMYLTESDKLPEKWTGLGLDWKLTYNQWNALLQQLGFSIRVVKPPTISQWQGKDAFSAEIVATKTTGIPLKIELAFRYAQGTTSPNDRGTLYSITVVALK
jgi:hypothetical protein